jgi:Co/Zn/Cd efflux system component
MLAPIRAPVVSPAMSPGVRRWQAGERGHRLPRVKDCCESKAGELAELRVRQGRVLVTVLAINAVMFVVEAAGGVVARSTALLADSLDMFGDASVYALSLWVLHRGPVWRARAALVKGAFMGLFGAAVLVEAALKLPGGITPEAHTMSAIGLIALGANLVCLVLLYRHRTDDLNLRSTWLCSRNDIIANAGVILAAIAVGIIGSGWPDVLVGALIAALFLRSAGTVLREAVSELRRLPRAA